MNKVIKGILDRFSCREYTDESIPEKDLDLIMKTAVSAPTAGNRQRWHFTVITNKKLIRRIAQTMAKVLNQEDYNLFNPAVYIIPSTPKDVAYGAENIACALENIYIAANSLGIGACWINQLQKIIDNKDIREMLKEIGISEEEAVYGTIVLGYPKSNECKKIKRIGVVNYIN